MLFAIETRREHKETLMLSVAAFMGESLHVMYIHKFHTHSTHNSSHSRNQHEPVREELGDVQGNTNVTVDNDNGNQDQSIEENQEKPSAHKICALARVVIIFVYWIVSVNWVVGSGDHKYALENHAVLIVYYKGLQFLPTILDHIDLCCFVPHSNCCEEESVNAN